MSSVHELEISCGDDEQHIIDEEGASIIISLGQDVDTEAQVHT